MFSQGKCLRHNDNYLCNVSDSFRDLAPAVLPATAPQNTATGGNR